MLSHWRGYFVELISNSIAVLFSTGIFLLCIKICFTHIPWWYIHRSVFLIETLFGTTPIIDILAVCVYLDVCWLCSEKRWKTEVKWHDNGTVTYKNLRWWNFEPDMSNGTENDTIYSLNLPLLVMYSFIWVDLIPVEHLIVTCNSYKNI